MKHKISNQIVNATKWSAVTEVVAKLISPLTNILLARILVPEAFGVIATVTMITSFADMFTDSGFQKYLVQHEYKDEKEKYNSANVAFWTNLGISIIFWIIITIFRNRFAELVGNPGLGNVIAIASIQLPLTSFSSIQMALYRRDFDFKSLFIIRMITICIPFVITIPLALLGFGYWSLIIGTISIQLVNALALTIRSKWKPSIYYNFRLLKDMFSFSIWSLLEAISIWLTTWADVFIIGTIFTQYYLGLYKTSISMVNSLMAIITSAIVPVLFSVLSRLQNDNDKFNTVFLKFQRTVSILVLPLGIGVFLYSDLATRLLLGEQWVEASPIIGIWGLTSALHIVFSYFTSELFRAKGQPKLSLTAQVIHLVFLIPACLLSARYGFWALVYTRSLMRLQSIIVKYLILKIKFGFQISSIFKNLYETSMAAAAMGILGYLLKQISEGIPWSFLSIIILVFFYFGVLLLFPKMRNELPILIKKIIPMKINLSNRD